MCSASKDCCRCTWPWDPGELLRKCEAFFDFARFIGTEPLETTTTRGACMSPGWTRPRYQKSAHHRAPCQVIHNLGYQGCYPLRLGLPGTLQLSSSWMFQSCTDHVLSVQLSEVKAIRQFCAAWSSLRSLGRFALPVSFTWTNFLWRHRRNSEPH